MTKHEEIQDNLDKTKNDLREVEDDIKKLRDSQKKMRETLKSDNSDNLKCLSKETSKKSNEYSLKTRGYSVFSNSCLGLTSLGLDLTAVPNMRIASVKTGQFKLGTTFFIEDYGFAVAKDELDESSPVDIELFFDCPEKVKSWGSKVVSVKVLG